LLFVTVQPCRSASLLLEALVRHQMGMPVVGVRPAFVVDLGVTEQLLQDVRDVGFLLLGQLVDVALPDDHRRPAAAAVDDPAEVVLVVAGGPGLSFAKRTGHHPSSM